VTLESGIDDLESIPSLEDLGEASESLRSLDESDNEEESDKEESDDSSVWKEIRRASDDELASCTSRCGSSEASTTHARPFCPASTGKTWNPWKKNICESKSSLSQAEVEARLVASLQAGCVSEAEQWTNMLIRKDSAWSPVEGLAKELIRLDRLPMVQGWLAKRKKSGFKLDAALFERHEAKAPTGSIAKDSIKLSAHAAEFVPKAAEAPDEPPLSSPDKDEGKICLRLDNLLADDAQRRAHLICEAKSSWDLCCKLPPYSAPSSWLAAALKGASLEASQYPRQHR